MAAPPLPSAVPVGNDQKRIVLYSHDTMGLGHMRRNLLLAQTLVGACQGATVLLLSGAKEIHRFDIPAGVDCVSLPALRKDTDGGYHSRQWSLPLPELIQLRRDTIRAVVGRFAPDAIVVDKVAQGIGGELIPTLREQRRRGATCILGLRDILDEPEVVQREWQAAGGDGWVDRHYDQIWVYGDPQVYDAVHEYGFSAALAAKIRFTGYLDQTARQSDPFPIQHENTPRGKEVAPWQGRHVACLVGGGQDGEALATNFARTPLPPEWRGTLIAGPYMPAASLHQLRELIALRRDMQLIDFVPDADSYVRQADRVIAMGGYNTVCSILSFGRPALLVPRISPRQEQWIRAARLADLGLVDVLHPNRLHHAAMGSWLERPQPETTSARSRIDLRGLDRVAAWFRELPPACDRRAARHATAAQRAAGHRTAISPSTTTPHTAVPQHHCFL